jgi:hypothetical protein
MYAYFLKINTKRPLRKEFIDNLVIRFMRQQKYHHKDTVKALHDYLDFEKDFRTRYTYDDPGFKLYRDMDVQKYLITDFYFHRERFHGPASHPKQGAKRKSESNHKLKAIL